MPERFADSTSIAGTADLNVPMFIALRRFTLVCTIVLERSLMHKQHDRATIGAVALMIGGMSVECFCMQSDCTLQAQHKCTWSHSQTTFFLAWAIVPHHD